jgi:hypothetical protein
MGLGKLTENKAEKDEVLPTQALATWTENRGPIALQIGLSTFGILALELALIRWTSGQIQESRVNFFFLGHGAWRCPGTQVQTTYPLYTSSTIPSIDTAGLLAKSSPHAPAFSWSDISSLEIGVSLNVSGTEGSRLDGFDFLSFGIILSFAPGYSVF